MTQKQKGYVGLGVMVVLAGATVFLSNPLYNAIDTMAAKSISYTPGSYMGSADGFGGKVTATVTISENGIDAIVLAGNDETPELGGAALEKLAPKFMEAQSSPVDAVSGCTITSNAAMEAVQNALDQASGKIDVVPVEETEAPKATEAETEKETEAAKAEETRTFQAGTYTGTAKGFGGDVTATVVITDSGIESVELVGNDETEELGGAALKKLSKKFVEAQTSTVDAVSGCTITSDAAMAAVEQALEQAAGGAADAGSTAVEAVSYAAGTYTGTAKGFGGDVNATVVITDSGIESVELVGNDETEELGGAALKKLSKKFVEAQSSKVDAVSGCTITSDAAMAAVAQALEQAVSEEAAPAGAEAAEAESYKAGTYTGTAKGFGGDVTATVVITDSGIESVELVGNDETEELGGAALKKLSKKFVEAQSSKVDAVSGCTITSDAAMEAVKQALDQAK